MLTPPQIGSIVLMLLLLLLAWRAEDEAPPDHEGPEHDDSDSDDREGPR